MPKQKDTPVLKVGRTKKPKKPVSHLYIYADVYKRLMAYADDEDLVMRALASKIISDFLDSVKY